MGKFRSLILLLLAFITVFSFVGCGTESVGQNATPNITDADIIEVVQLDLNLDNIASVNEDGVANVKNEIKLFAKTICDEMNTKLNNKINSQLSNKDLDMESYKILLSYINGIKLTDLNFKLDGTILKYEFCVKYANVNLYKYYYDEQGVDSFTVDLGGNFFYNKIQIVGDEQILKHKEFSDRCEVGLKSYFGNIIEKLNKYMVFNLHASKHRLKSNSDYAKSNSNDMLF